MRHFRLLVFPIAILTLILAACGGASAPQLDSIAVPAGAGGGATPSPTITLSADKSEPGSANVETLEPTTAADATDAAPVENSTPGEAAATVETVKVESTSETATPAPTAVPQTILAQALESPGLMWCLADRVGMGLLIELDSRSATSQERSTINSCLSDTREIAAWNAEWPKRIDAAFTPSTCGEAPATNFPSSYYKGPLIDSHLHIPQLPDDQYGEQDTGYVAPRGPNLTNMTPSLKSSARYWAGR